MIIIISICSFIASLLTLYSGFGLGTLLMPVIAIFFPVPVAIAITAVVHFANNIFKLILLRRNVNWRVTLKFGIPAAFAAMIGAGLLILIAKFPPLFSYDFFHLSATIEPVKIVAGILLIIFATLEWRTISKNAFLNSKWLPIGGLLSGFFGGLSGQQGAFRTPFLLHAGLTKNQFVATNASIAVLVDMTRLIVYGLTLHLLLNHQFNFLLIIATTIAAFCGAILGVIWLEKITFTFIQRLVAILLYLLGILLLLGII